MYSFNTVINMSIKLKVIGDTFFKQRPIDSRSLEDNVDKVFVKSGAEYEIHSYNRALIDGHLKVALKGAFLGSKNLTTWYVYAPHIDLQGTEPGNNPKDDVVAAVPVQTTTYTGPRITVPGKGLVYLSEPIIPNGNFNWAEATKNGTRIPANSNVTTNIIKIAGVMQEVRKLLGDKPIKITSWYRDPATNRRVGGSTRSRHIIGDAIDFSHINMSPPQVLKALDGWWGSKGGLASGVGFTHIDSRGYRARWRYAG